VGGRREWVKVDGVGRGRGGLGVEEVCRMGGLRDGGNARVEGRRGRW
jgi:hypothetical protein